MPFCRNILHNISNQFLQYLCFKLKVHHFNGCYLVSGFNLENFHFIYVLPKRESFEFRDEKYCIYSYNVLNTRAELSHFTQNSHPNCRTFVSRCFLEKTEWRYLWYLLAESEKRKKTRWILLVCFCHAIMWYLYNNIIMVLTNNIPLSTFTISSILILLHTLINLFIYLFIVE